MALATCSFDCGRGFTNRLAARIEFGDDVMGIFDALNTSVAGLQAQSFALQNISGNIANAQTTGYKGIGTSFVDLVSGFDPGLDAVLSEIELRVEVELAKTGQF